MLQLRFLISCCALLLALAPMVASADHAQDELANAEAQLTVAEGEAAAIDGQGTLDASNDRAIALAQSAADRLAQLQLAQNGRAIEQIAHALADAARVQGTVDAQNDLVIAQAKAAVLVAKADATLANALAIGRTDEIANARAQSADLHGLADLIAGAQAQANMSNDLLIGQDRADAIHTPGVAAAENGAAMAANELLAADTVLAAGEVNASSDMQVASSKGEALLAHAESSLANAEAMAAE